MSAIQACVQCRAASVKCDLARPSCGRCIREDIVCLGLPMDSMFVFRNENEVAKRNSSRARGHRKQSSSNLAACSSAAEHASHHTLDEDIGEPVEVRNQDYKWLNQRAIAEIPAVLKRDIETRAVERFFVNWILHPGNRGCTPGHMDELPMQFHKAQPNSVLRLAVRAVAFADLRNGSIGSTPSHIKARQQYGSALSRMRDIVNERQNLDDDNVLTSMILIDNFELMYLGRINPHSPHEDAIKHTLRMKGDGQLYSPTRFSLWRLTHYRLQLWQTLFRENPNAQQRYWVSKLNLERPELRICSEVLQMNVLSAEARILTQNNHGQDARQTETLQRAQRLVNEIQVLLKEVDSWTAKMSNVWKAKVEDARNITAPQDGNERSTLPIPDFPYPQLLSYDDFWLAYIWNFYSASEIVLRESLAELVIYTRTAQGQTNSDPETMALVQKQHDAVVALSGTIIKSIPMLLGFAMDPHERHMRLQFPQEGRMAGRLFALFSLWVVQRAQFTPAQHRRTASDVVAWLNARHGLA